nr:uncharacterized protein LOC117993840 [Maniola hyperantus]XP_034837599.1 uncharacterized protein LOC117993840 [Maniola hyperantus]
MVGMMWFKRDPKVPEKVDKVDGVVNKLRRKKPVILKPTRESSERETSADSDKEKRRYSDILDMKVSLERRDESDESLYESADCHSDAISASDDALPRLIKTPTMSKESLKLAITDEEGDLTRAKKGHRKTMSLSYPLEIVKCLGDELFDHKEKNCDKKKSRESLWSEEDRDSIHGSTMKLDQLRKNSKKDDKVSGSRKNSSTDNPKRKSSKGSSVSALNFLRRKKTPTSMKAVEAVVEVVDGIINASEILNHTKFFLEEEKRFASATLPKPPVETDSDEDMPAPKVIGEHRRRLSRQTSRSKSKVRGKSQSLKVNTLRKSHSGTLKKGKKKSIKTPLVSRSRQASIAEPSPLVKKKHSDAFKQNSWLFSGSRGDSRREGSTDEPSAPDVDVDTSDATAKEPEKETNWKGASAGARGVNRAESCRERDAPRRGKHRNASDPNRLTAHHNHDLEPGAVTAPSGSSSSSSLSSRSNESNTVAADQQASQSDWSEEEEPLAAQWSDSLPTLVRESIVLSARIRKRQEVIHELIVSEGSHVRWLKVLGVDFLKPLERQPSLLPAEELRALFPNLPGVRERHARLYADLRSVRSEAPNHVVQIRPVADAMLNTLGDSGYASCLSKFCRGQRMALDSLRERRRKNKELHQFLAGREQLPRCGRLQLRDLLACVWQRLTKYQLLLESILKTVAEDLCENEEVDSVDDIAQLKKALNVAKDVLHSVDTAIRTAENEHRLRSIQNKLEVRIPGGVGGSGGEFEELRRLDLTSHALRHEGELSLRTDTKKISVLALMLEDSLVLLQREGDKFVLRPLAQPSHAALLSPLIKWDKVLFRPNAAVRNTFFLMNINGIQMHELSANTTNEYLTWVKHIQESPLARLAETKPSLTPSHQHTRSTDDSGINVSRNPSDASEKSTTSSVPPEEPCESERDRASLERDDASNISERDKQSLEREEENDRDARSASVDKEENGDDRIKQSRATVGRISTHGGDALPALETSAAVVVSPPSGAVHTAQRVFSHQERLRRLDEAISRALRAKSAVVAELLGVPPNSFTHLAELAIADTMGQVDICGGLLPSESESAPDLHQLLLAAQAQANQLTESLSGALALSEASAVAARSGRCDSCRRPRHALEESNEQPTEVNKSIEETDRQERFRDKVEGAEADASYDILADLSANEPHIDSGLDGEAGEARAARLASRLVGGVCGIQAALASMLTALPALETERRGLRAEVAALRERVDALRHRHDYQMTEEIFPKGVDPSIQDQPSNGG